MQRQTNPTDNIPFELGAGSRWATLGVAGNASRGTKRFRVYSSGTMTVPRQAPKTPEERVSPKDHIGAAGKLRVGRC